MKILMFADLHLERQFAWADGAAASRRRHGLRASLENIVSLAHDHGVDAILCGGDLYEDEFFSPDLTKFVAATLDCGIPTFVSPGNHDHLSDASLYRRASLPSSVHVFDEEHFTARELAPGLRIWGTAHVRPRGTRGFFDPGSEGPTGRIGPGTGQNEGTNIAVFHGSERGGFAWEGEDKHPHAPFDAAQIPAAGFDYAFVGHHHRPVVGDHHCYPGNPDPLEFGEEGPRGAVIATINPAGAVVVTSHTVAASTTHAIEVDVTGCEHGSDVLSLVSSSLASFAGFVRVDLTGVLDPDVELDRHQLQDLGRGLEGFVLRNQVRRAYRLEEILAEEASVRAQFVRLAQSSGSSGDHELTDEDRDLIVELGLRAFDNRRDLEIV